MSAARRARILAAMTMAARKFEILDHLTAPGNPAKPNDDAWCGGTRLAAVIDGATGLGDLLLPGRSDAAWLAHGLAERLAAQADRGGAREALTGALADIEQAFIAQRRRPPADTYEIPFASMMLVEALGDGEIEALWFGDCAALVARPGEPVQVVGDAFEKRGGEAERAAQAAAGSGRGPAGLTALPELLPGLRASRNRLNQPGGSWVLAPDRACADHAQSARIAAPSGAIILVASDGFLALATDYGRHDADSLVAACLERGLAALLAEVRAIEAEDPQGLAYPRFKTSDDATAVLLRVV